MKFFIVAAFSISLWISPVSVPASDSSDEDHICFRRIDSNNDGQMHFQEFVPFYGKDKEKFDLMDEDKNGSVSHDEYEMFLYEQEEGA